MAEIISFPQRMYFTALRNYDAASGIGGVVAVLWAPVNGHSDHSDHSEQRQESGCHPALAELRPEAAHPMVAVPSNPAMARNCKGEARVTHGHR